MIITAIIATAVVLIVALAVLATPAEKRTQHPCYFAGVHVELGDREIGDLECSGPAEYSYSVRREHPAHLLTSVKICPAHVGSLNELAAALADGASSYWVVPD